MRTNSPAKAVAAAKGTGPAKQAVSSTFRDKPLWARAAVLEVTKMPAKPSEPEAFVEAGGYEDRQWWTEAGQAWLASQPEVATVIAGVTSVEQVEENVRAGRVVGERGVVHEAQDDFDAVFARSLETYREVVEKGRRQGAGSKRVESHERDGQRRTLIANSGNRSWAEQVDTDVEAAFRVGDIPGLLLKVMRPDRPPLPEAQAEQTMAARRRASSASSR